MAGQVPAASRRRQPAAAAVALQVLPHNLTIPDSNRAGEEVADSWRRGLSSWRFSRRKRVFGGKLFALLRAVIPCLPHPLPTTPSNTACVELGARAFGICVHPI